MSSDYFAGGVTAGGWFTNRDVFVHDQFLDTNTMDFTTNYFHAYDVPLMTNGNFLTVRVTDRAGNTATTNFTVTLDYATATNPPVVKLTWPQAGMQVSGSNTTLRGTVSDETGTLQAQVVNGDGTTNLISGVIERNGTFWVENVPLNGTNHVSIQATDAAGNMTTTNFTVNPSSLQLQITGTPEGDALWKGRGLVSGVVSAAAATVTVNGTDANVATTANAAGTFDWYADGVPIYGEGTATFDAKAMPASGGGNPGGSGNGGANVSSAVEMPSIILVTGHGAGGSYTSINYTPTTTDTSIGISSWGYSTVPAQNNSGITSFLGSHKVSSHSYGKDYSNTGQRSYEWSQDFTKIDWVDTSTDSSGHTTTDSGSEHKFTPFLTATPFGDHDGEITGIPGRDISVIGWSGTFGGYNGYPPTWVSHFYARKVRHDWHWDDGAGNGHDSFVTVGANTTLTLFTGGKAGSKKQRWWKVRGSAEEYGRSMIGGWAYTPVRPVHGIRMFGKAADANGDVWVTLADNDRVNLQINCPGVKHYNAGATAELTCKSVRINFIDQPSRGIANRPCHWTAKLEICQVDELNPTQINPITSINYGMDIDASGHVTMILPTGDTGTIIVDPINPYYDDFSHPVFSRSGITITAHYIGCANYSGQLNWHQLKSFTEPGQTVTNADDCKTGCPYYLDPNRPDKYGVDFHTQFLP